MNFQRMSKIEQRRGWRGLQGISITANHGNYR
jgi:hypothetical protein